jgi:hypothetical protein
VSLDGSYAAKELTLYENISVQLGTTTHHNIYDQWAVAAVVCGGQADPPKGTTAVIRTDREGGADVNQLTLREPYQGSAAGPQDVYIVNQLFTVRAPGTTVQRVLVMRNSENAPWTNGEPEFTLTAGTELTTRMEHPLYGYANKTNCIKWNAYDWEVEDALALIGLHVTVTRGVDNADAPGGYVYTIYFDSDAVDNIKVPLLVANGVDSECDPAGADSNLFNPGANEQVVVESVVEGSPLGGRFTTPHTCHTDDMAPRRHVPCPAATVLPLGASTDKHTPQRFLGGRGDEPLRVYKTTGLQYSIEFDSNLGDLQPLAVNLNGLPDSSVAVNDLVSGVLPKNFDIEGLPTGIPYYTRVNAHTVEGYSREYSLPTAAKPMGRPGTPLQQAAGIALHVDEVQSLTLGATHIDEVQVVTSSSEHVPEVQLVSLTAAEGQLVRGSFALKFPEVQIITTSALAAPDPTVTTWRLVVSQDAPDVATLGLVTTFANTSCLPWAASASEVEDALEQTTLVDDVAVSRSGDGSEFFADFGYSWTVSFVGEGVSGNVRSMRAVICDNPSLTLIAKKAVQAEVATTNEGDALSTGLEIHLRVVALGPTHTP